MVRHLPLPAFLPALALGSFLWVADARAQAAKFEGKTLDEWIEQLNGDDPVLRWKAAIALGKTGAAGKPAIAALTAAKEDKSGPVRKAAEDALKKIEAAVLANPAPSAKSGTVQPKAVPDPAPKPESKTTPAGPERSPAGAGGAAAAVDKLMETLRSGKDPEKADAAKELGDYGEDAIAAAPLLCELTLRSNPALRTAAVRAIEKIHPNLFPHLDTLLSSDDPKKHIAAAARIAQMGRGGAAAVPVLLDHLYNPHPARRGYPAARGSVWSGDITVSVVEADMMALVSVAGENPKVVKFLVTQAQNSGGIAVRIPGPRVSDREAIYQIDIRIPAAASVAVLAARVPETREEIKPLLIRFLAMADRQPLMTVFGLKGLAGCGPEAKDAIPQIKELTRARHPLIREWAFNALTDIGDETVSTGGNSPKEIEIIASGSGFVVAPGCIMTNVHVIDGDGRIMVRIPKLEKPVSATVVARHPTRDIAIIRVNLPDTVKLAPLPVNGKAVRRGDEVAVLGFPLGDAGGTGLKLTKGVVSAVPEKANNGMMLLDAKVNPGNSGGPLCDVSGNVVGIVTAKSYNATFVDSYGMAIPGDELAAMLKKSLKDYAAPAIGAKELKWADVDAAVSPSVLMILKVK